MKDNIKPASLNDLLSLFTDTLSPIDIMSAKAMSEASNSITQERIRLKMNQQNFANYIHASQSLISRCESGQYNFTIQKLAEIAVALDMDLTVKLRRKPELHISYNDEYSYASLPFQQTFVTNTRISNRTNNEEEKAHFFQHTQTHKQEYYQLKDLNYATKKRKEPAYVKLCQSN